MVSDLLRFVGSNPTYINRTHPMLVGSAPTVLLRQNLAMAKEEDRGRVRK
jgi:hypothetical protein